MSPLFQKALQHLNDYKKQACPGTSIEIKAPSIYNALLFLLEFCRHVFTILGFRRMI